MKKENHSKKRVTTPGTEARWRDNSSRPHGERRPDSFAYAKSIGYSEAEMKSVPDGATATHGCGNLTALADLIARSMIFAALHF